MNPRVRRPVLRRLRSNRLEGLVIPVALAGLILVVIVAALVK